MSKRTLLILLASATGLGPFAMQAIAPALPDVAEDLGVSAAAAQLLISLALVGMALAALVLGTLSDLFGRRPVMVWALAIATLGAALATVAPTIEAAVAGRFLQAAAASAGMVISRAVVTDRYPPSEAASFIATLTAVMAVMPMFAPWIGGELVGVFGWRGILAAIALLSALLLLAIWRLMPETLVERPADAGFGSLLPGLAYAAESRRFWAFALLSSSQISAFFFFVGAAPFVMEEAFGHGPSVYGRYFILVSICFMAGNLAASRLSARLGAARMVRLGFSVGMGGLVLGLWTLNAGAGGPLSLILPACAGALGAGLSMPAAIAEAVADRRERAGAASSLLGLLQFGMAGATAQIAGAIDHSSPAAALALMAAVLLAGFAAWVALGLTWRRRAA